MWTYAQVWSDLAASSVGTREAIVCGDRRLTFVELDARAEQLAAVFDAHGLRPGDAVAICLVNCVEYLETFFAALKVGCVPVNVNYRYVAGELAHLLQDAGARAIVHHNQFGATVTDALAGGDDVLRLEVVDGTGGEPDAGSLDYELALRIAPPRRDPHQPSGDDLITIYTGGTTGMPKGVMWRNDDLYVALWQMRKPGTEPPDAVAWCERGGRAPTCLPVTPLMHGTALWMSMSTLSGGGKVVLIDTIGLDAGRVWSEVEREDVEILTIVGDASAHPLLDALDAASPRPDVSSLTAVMSSGVVLSPESKRRFLAHLPGAMVIDSLGSTEGAISRSVVTAANADEASSGTFAPRAGVRVISEETGTDVVPGSGEIGLLAVGGRLPVGYRNDPEKSATTFRVIEGECYTMAGDHATVEADGTIRLLGRGSACINTGGEKVYAEEVEMVFREHEAVADCVILGLPHERWGEMVVALVQLVNPTATTVGALDAYAKQRMAGYKRPKEYLVLDHIPRGAAGKAEYVALRKLASERLATTR